MGTFCSELCKNGLTDRLAVLIVDSGGPKEAQVQSYSSGGANIHKFSRICQVAPVGHHGRKTVQPGEYD